MKSLARRLTAATAVPLIVLGLSPAPAQAAKPAYAAAPAQTAVGERPVLEKSDPIRIMPLGDSITWGVGSNSNDSYRSALFWRLGAAGVNVDFVGSQRSGAGRDRDHEGHKGWTIAQIADHVDEWLATYGPDVILLHIGTNDMMRGGWDAPRHLDELLDRIAADRPGAQVFVAKIVGLGDYSDVSYQNRRTAGYNEAVARIVSTKGPDFHLVDQSDVRGIDMWNREHPNDYGYQKMAWNWYVALESVLGGGGEAAWPGGDDPYRARFGYRCIQRSTLGRAAQGCHTWYRQPGLGWRLPVQVKQRYRVKVEGKVVTRVRIVTRWIAAS
jgi:lysophospholipase L1-like esterase